MQRLIGSAAAILFLVGGYAIAGEAAEPPARTEKSSGDHRPQPRTQALDVAETPYMGWNTYYGLGGAYTEAEVRDIAKFLVSSGMRDAGYDHVWLDGGWQANPSRNDAGDLIPDPQRFPSGMERLTADLHEMGLKAGIYTDAGPYIEGVCGLGSHGNYQRDADRFAAWGFDAVKVDFLCGVEADLDPQTVYREFAAALENNSSDRRMMLNICNPVSDEWSTPSRPEQRAEWSYTFGPTTGDSWRTETDVAVEPSPGEWSAVLRNMRSNALHPEAHSPGHYNDPDYLIPMRPLPDGGHELNLEESRSQLGMWAIMAAPLVVGSDPRTLPEEMLDVLTNPEVIAVDQDPLAVQGVRVANDGTGGEVWSKLLSGQGQRAVALLNSADSERSLTVDFADAGLTGRVQVRDIWRRADAGTHTGSYTTKVPAHGVALLLLNGTDDVTGTDLGGDPGGDPAIVRTDDTHAKAFVRGVDGALWQNVRDGGEWSTEWTSLGAPAETTVVGQPSVHRSTGDRIDVFVQASDQAVWRRTSTGGTWGEWRSLGGKVSSAPSIAWSSPSDWTAFATGSDGQTWMRTADSDWEGLGSPGGKGIHDRPGAVVDDAGTTLVAVRTRTNEVWMRSKRPHGTWSDWENLGGTVSSGPTLVGTSGRVYLLARGADYRLWQRNLVDGSWGDWFVRNAYASSAIVGAVGADPGSGGHPWVVVRGVDGTVHQSVL